jgi:hypothetical protein
VYLTLGVGIARVGGGAEHGEEGGEQGERQLFHV